jgi:hypothetical protein
MKIYTQKQVNQIKNQALNKIYSALNELHEKDNSEDGLVKCRHNELLDLALKHLNSNPTEDVYPWILKAELKGSFLN